MIPKKCFFEKQFQIWLPISKITWSTCRLSDCSKTKLFDENYFIFNKISPKSIIHYALLYLALFILPGKNPVFNDKYTLKVFAVVQKFS